MTHQVINDRTMHVCALQRSGHHAVIQWIMRNAASAAGPVCFLNNCKPGVNPFISGIPGSVLPGIDPDSERLGGFSPKGLLICNYEDRDLATVYAPRFAEEMTTWLGPSRHTLNVLVIRDPFNLIASKYRWITHSKRKPSVQVISGTPGLWKAYAKEFLRRTHYMPDPVACISYNRWFTDAEYRRQVARTLEISAADEGRTQVAPWGANTWGDSFDNMSYDGRATDMKVLDRWRHFADDEFYRSLVSDPELHELSREVFGHVPGTEMFLSRMGHPMAAHQSPAGA